MQPSFVRSEVIFMEMADGNQLLGWPSRPIVWPQTDQSTFSMELINWKPVCPGGIKANSHTITGVDVGIYLTRWYFPLRTKSCLTHIVMHYCVYEELAYIVFYTISILLYLVTVSKYANICINEWLTSIYYSQSLLRLLSTIKVSGHQKQHKQTRNSHQFLFHPLLFTTFKRCVEIYMLLQEINLQNYHIFTQLTLS